MGTRGLMAIQCDNEYHVAQYFQFDSYPSGVGREVLEFAATSLNTPSKLEKFRENVRKNCGFDPSVDPEDEIYDATALLVEIAKGNEYFFPGSLNFAGDSLFCEWAYVIDLDKETVECFKGFNTTPLTPEDRFYDVGGREGKETFDGRVYYGVKLIDSVTFSDIIEGSIWDITERWSKHRDE